MTFSYCVFASIRFDYFCENLAALLALQGLHRVPNGSFLETVETLLEHT